MINLFLILFLNGCSADLSREEGIRFVPYNIQIENGPVIRADLGKLEVPENRSKPNGSKVTLHFVRLKSTSDHPGSPIFYLAGGPGVSGISMLKTERLIIFEALRSLGDVIIPDQRGTGMTQPLMTSSAPLGLPLDKTIDAKESLDAFVARMRKVSDGLKKQHIDIAAYNTRENTADMNAIREALGSEKMTLWGHSYGSHLGSAIIKYYGGFVDKAILSGVNGLDQRFRMPDDVNTVFEEMDRIIDASPKLRKEIPSLTALIKQELEKLEHKPVTKEIYIDQKKIAVTIGRSDVEVFTAINMGSIGFIRELPQMFYNMSQGDYYTAAEYAYKTLKMRAEGTPMSFSMHYASGCSAERKAAIAESANHGMLRNAINYPFMTDELQAIWSVPDLGEEFRGPFKSDVPVLLISGNLDGRTSVGNAMEVKKNFSKAIHVIFRNASHDVLAPQSVSLMLDFLKGRPLKDTIMDIPDFDFYSLKSRALTVKLSTMLMLDGVDKFRSFFLKLNAPESEEYINSTLILPVAYQLIKQEKPELAVEALKINQLVFPKEHWQICAALGDAYRETGDQEQAKHFYKRSLELNPLSFSAYKYYHKN